MKTLLASLLVATILPFGTQGSTRTVTLGGHDQKLHLYGPFTGRPVILSSGDGGWMHLAPHVADMLAANGYFVVGVDSKSYLTSGTSGKGSLTPRDIARDYGTLLNMFASEQPAILAGVSEGAGLSVVAAADASNRTRVSGVVTYGLGERNELAWRWKDSLIYFTKGVPSEPTFNASAFIPHIGPVPLAFIRATHDEFVPQTESDRLIASATAPVKAWTIPASDHRFSDNLGDLDRATTQALNWIANHP